MKSILYLRKSVLLGLISGLFIFPIQAQTDTPTDPGSTGTIEEEISSQEIIFPDNSDNSEISTQVIDPEDDNSIITASIIPADFNSEIGKIRTKELNKKAFTYSKYQSSVRPWI